MSALSFPLAVFGLGGTELVVLLLIVLLLFGGSKLPQLAKGMGESIREFKKAAKEDPDEKKADDKTSGDSHGKN